uniref:Uncharacterized protein n=1 Tax=Craspedostauros australis TaxID=1486917 RepID=A0A7R9ZKZ4_9STRA|mmetsp:Transcript_12795/g.35336  ORF Transcript_12795/g.35336 Transcript_12795/m.35336 type:complete len:102 (+) Transcript_12795:151-456(+)
MQVWLHPRILWSPRRIEKHSFARQPLLAILVRSTPSPKKEATIEIATGSMLPCGVLLSRELQFVCYMVDHELARRSSCVCNLMFASICSNQLPVKIFLLMK